MKIKKLTHEIWEFRVNNITLHGTYNECLARLEVYARIWGI